MYTPLHNPNFNTQAIYNILYLLPYTHTYKYIYTPLKTQHPTPTHPHTGIPIRAPGLQPAAGTPGRIDAGRDDAAREFAPPGPGGGASGALGWGGWGEGGMYMCGYIDTLWKRSISSPNQSIHLRAPTHTQEKIHTLTYTYIHTYLFKYIYINTHTLINIYTHIKLFNQVVEECAERLTDEDVDALCALVARHLGVGDTDIRVYILYGGVVVSCCCGCCCCCCWLGSPNHIINTTP